MLLMVLQEVSLHLNLPGKTVEDFYLFENGIVLVLFGGMLT